MRKLLPLFALLIPCVLSSFSPKNAEAAAPRKIKLVFLGDKGHHKPEDRFRQVQGIFSQKGIDLNYTENLESLNPGFLKNYDGVLIFANHAKISDEQEKALLDFVEAGKALIPVHCASYCFL
ncbi:MAG: ThuA domain-containing protein, partial [Planctomycetia bacterium]